METLIATTPGQIPAPSMGALDNFAVNRKGDFEVIRNALYDTVTLTGAAGGNTNAKFFVSIDGKTLDDTNMQSAGQLPHPKFFLVESIELMPLPNILISAGGMADDIQAFYESGHLAFPIGSKNYLREAPLGVFPPKTHVGVDVGGNLLTEYAQLKGRPYNLTIPLLIEPSQNFEVDLLWDTPFVIPSTQDMKVICRLDGYEYRESQ